MVATPHSSWDGLNYPVIGDGRAGSGVVEAVADLTGKPGDKALQITDILFLVDTAAGPLRKNLSF